MATKLTPAETVHLVITSTIAIGGQIKRTNSLVEVSETDARFYLERGKARLATADDLPVAPPAADESEADEADEADEAPKRRRKKTTTDIEE